MGKKPVILSRDQETKNSKQDPCTNYVLDARTGTYHVQALGAAIRGTSSLENCQDKEEKALLKSNKAFLQAMKDRPNRDNIELARKEYEHVSQQLCGKPKQLSMYKIKQQLERIKSEGHSGGDLPAKLSIFAIEEQRQLSKQQGKTLKMEKSNSLK